MKKYILGLVVFCVTLIASVTCAFAEGKVEVSFTPSSNEVEIGQEFEVKIKLSADKDISEVNFIVTYDANIIEFVSASKGINGDSGVIVINDKKSEVSSTKEYKVKFKAIAVGTCDFLMSKDPSFLDADFNTLDSTCDTNMITVKEAKSVSTDADLKSLMISPGQLDVEFDPKNHTYKTDVPTSSEYIVVAATANDESAKVEVKGADELEYGANRVEIIVTAPAGNTQNYILSVYRKTVEEEEAEQEENSKKDDEDADDYNGEICITEEDGDVTLSNAFKYKIVSLTDKTKIPLGFKETKISLFGTTIVAYILEDDTENDFVLIYAKNTTTESEGFYQYDKLENTLQRYTGATVSTGKKTSAVTLTQDKYQQKINMCCIIIAILAVLLVFFVLLFAKQLLGINNKDDDMFE